MKIGRQTRKARNRAQWLKGYWERRTRRKQDEIEEAKQADAPDEAKCSHCGVACHTKRKGVTVSACKRNAKKAGKEAPNCFG